MKRKITSTTKREIKPKRRQVMMHSAVAHPPLSDAQPRAGVSARWPARPSFSAERCIPRYGLPLWLVRVSSPGPAPSQLLVDLLAGRTWEGAKSLIGISTAEQQLKQHRVLNTLLTRNPEHRAETAAGKKAKTIPAKTRTSINMKNLSKTILKENHCS